MLNNEMKYLSNKRIGGNASFHASKEEALGAAVKAPKDNQVSVWKTPEGKFAVIKLEDREIAYRLEYELVVDTPEIFDKIREKGNIDEIEEA